MKTGDSIFIQAKVLRVTGKRLDAQTADGQLIQTAVENVMTEKNQEKQPAPPKKDVPKAPQAKSVPPAENKAVLNAPENKSGK
jgi:hypothetical protein